MITIIDYDAGNLRSVENALQFLGEEAKITRDPQEILKADKVILPGVGAFGDAMEKLHKYNLVSVIREVNEKQIPHMGWNSIQIKEGARLFQGIPQDAYVYFVHSYYLQAAREEDVAATTEYIVPIHASVESGNTFACQFHPEKSGDIGLQILKNFCNL